MNQKLVMRYPSAWHQEMWREGAPFGNGLIGGTVYGGVYKENILINHAFLWRDGELSDVSYTLPEIRRLLDEKKIKEADAVLTAELIDGNIGIPGVINEMLLQSQQSTYEENRLILLPVLPEKWRSRGHICGLLARGNVECDIYWGGTRAAMRY